VPRPYCATKMPHDALNELQRCAGTQFDADLVAAYVAMFREPAVAAVRETG
jgi:HD-GYP domain-containing protein (c-di-GMP phosphodiesterase class II)